MTKKNRWPSKKFRKGGAGRSSFKQFLNLWELNSSHCVTVRFS